MRQTEKGDWIIFTDIWLFRSTISRKCARLPGTASCGCVLFHGDWNRTGEIPKPDCPEFPGFAECDSVSPDENRKRLICRAKRVSSSCYPRIPNESGHPAASRFCRHFPSGQRKPAPHPHRLPDRTKTPAKPQTRFHIPDGASARRRAPETGTGKNVARHVNRIVSPYVIRNHETPFAPSQPGMTAGETRKNPADSRTIHRDRREISGTVSEKRRLMKTDRW